MPQKLSPDIITAAIAGFEAQKQHIDSKIAELRTMLDNRHAAAEAPKRKRRISAVSSADGASPEEEMGRHQRTISSNIARSTGTS